MSDDISRDPNWRAQFDVTPKADNAFEQEIACSPQGRISMPVVSAPLNTGPWLQPLHRTLP